MLMKTYVTANTLSCSRRFEAAQYMTVCLARKHSSRFSIHSLQT